MKTVAAVLVVAGCVLCSPLSAQQKASPQEVFKILGISVEGNTLADPAAIIANSGLKVGDEITVPGDQVGQAIRRLWGLKLFDDVQASIDRRVGNGIYILLTVRELQRFDHTEFVGRKEESEDDINKKVGLVKGQVFQPQEAIRIQKEVKKLYEKDGYLLAVVKVEPVKMDSVKNRIVLRITIDEGNEVQVDHIRFEGNHAFTDGDLRGAMDETVGEALVEILVVGQVRQEEIRRGQEEDPRILPEERVPRRADPRGLDLVFGVERGYGHSHPGEGGGAV